MKTQKELFEEWQNLCSVIQHAGNVIQNDLTSASSEEIKKMKESFLWNFDKIDDLFLLKRKIVSFLEEASKKG